MGFTKESAVTQLDIKFALPRQYPDVKFHFPMRLQLSREAQSAQQQFLALSDDERAARQHAHNVEQLADLLIEAPSEFDDLPRDERPLRERAVEYFGDETMQPIVSYAMSGYWQAVLPKDYL